MKTFVAVDWGTTSLRAVLMDSRAEVIQQRNFELGILSVAAGDFENVFQQCFGDWMEMPDTVCLMSGMVGSRQGWKEAAYCACPAGLGEIASRLCWLRPERLAIVPGLCCQQSGDPDRGAINTLPDVMRGEETQVLGALQLLGLNAATIVLPGTHSKWVSVNGGRIHTFSTYVTGEVYALLRQHSILARTLPASLTVPDDDAFKAGVKIALNGRGLLHTVFSTRTLALFERMKGDQLLEYLSGLVIGEEVRSGAPPPDGQVVLVGADALTRRYQMALAMNNIASQCLDAQATWAGLRAIAALTFSARP